MAGITIEFDRDACIGCGSCESACPGNWEMDDSKGELKAKPKKTQLPEIGCNREAEEICPVDAIKVIAKD